MARMSSTRKRVAGPRPAVVAAPAAKPPAAHVPPPAEDEELTHEQREAARAGGFHESSYELKNGLEVRESEWPADTTIPGALGER
jgi:hypothetical protein